jgi:hypothetical protein
MEITLTEMLKDYFAKTPLEQVKKDWEKSQEFDNVGPTFDEYMKILEKEEIKERNYEIAFMLDWREEQTGSWFQIKDNANYVVYSEHNNYPHKGLPFHRDWNWLMEAVEFIKKNIRSSSNTSDAKVGEYFIDEWEFKVKKFYIRLIQWTDKGWRMFDKENKDLSILYIIGENCQSEKEAIFLAVSDFAKLCNEKKFGRFKIN